MNLITELLRDAGFRSDLRQRPDPVSLGQALPLLGIELTDPRSWTVAPSRDFEGVGPELLERAQLAHGSASALPDARDEQPPPDDEHGPSVWLEARYLDADRQEIVVFPNDDDPIQRVMLYAPGAVHEGSVPLDVISAEVAVREERRRLLGLFRRHPSCPPGVKQADQTLHCPQGKCPKGGACVQWTKEVEGVVNLYCRCDHSRRRP